LPRQAASLPRSSTKRSINPASRWFKSAAQCPQPGDCRIPRPLSEMFSLTGTLRPTRNAIRSDSVHAQWRRSAALLDASWS
jgi:hypothetical protein